MVILAIPGNYDGVGGITTMYEGTVGGGWLVGCTRTCFASLGLLMVDPMISTTPCLPYPGRSLQPLVVVVVPVV